MAWEHLPFERGEPAQLLARGVQLLDDMTPASSPALRWYRAIRPALILGRGQQSALPAGTDLPIVTRFSGGGAVLMNDALLSLDVVLPSEHRWLDGPMTRVFEHVGAAWAEGLRSLGIEEVAMYRGPGVASRQGTPRQQLLAAICYATLGYGEVTVQGRKIVGLAQRRRRAGALVQCGLLRRWEPGPLLAAFAADAEDAEIRAAAIGLDELLTAAPTDDAVMAAVNAALREAIDSS